MEPPSPNTPALPYVMASETITPTNAAPEIPSDAAPAPETNHATGAEERGKSGKGGDAPLSPLFPGPAAPTVPLVGSDILTPAPGHNVMLAALRDQGLYQEALGAGEHRLRCPWANEHAEGEAEDAHYREADEYLPWGHFACAHTHAAPKDVHHLLEKLSLNPKDARQKPVIRNEAGELNRVLLASEIVLSQRPGYFASHGSLVKLRPQIETGAVVIEPATEHLLARELTAAADWERYDGRAKAYVRCDAPMRVTQQLVRGYQPKLLPTLKGISYQPYFAPDGKLVATAGYNPATGIYGQFDPAAFDVPEPTREAGENAITQLNALLREFEFNADHDRSAVLAAMLTATVRPILPLAPAFNITASTPGTGKSYLIDVIRRFVGPGVMVNMSYPLTAEEATKAIPAALAQKPSVLLFDDMQTDWLPHGVINKMMTSEALSERVLGSNRMMTVSTNTLVLGTGNNVAPVRDMGRRVLTIRLTSQSANPAMRSFKGNPVGAMTKLREHFVSCALTSIRAYLAAGAPVAAVPNIVSFDAWSHFCRQPLIWLGQPDPAQSLFEQLQSDPDDRALAEFLSAWIDLWGTKPVAVRKVADVAEARSDSELTETLFELPVIERGHVNRNKLGWYLKKNAGRIVGGHRIDPAPLAERRGWSVTRVAQAA